MVSIVFVSTAISYATTQANIRDMEVENTLAQEKIQEECLRENVSENACEEATHVAEEKSFALDAKCTAYCPCAKCCGNYAKNRPVDKNGNVVVLTASGERAIQGRTVGVDPNIIPLGSKVIINGQEYVAQDTGNSSVVKDNVIDIYFERHEDAVKFGVQYCTVTVVCPAES